MRHITFSETGIPIDKETLVFFEKKLEANLPKSYREFLLTYNGGCPEPCYFLVSGWERFPASFVMEFDGFTDEQQYGLIERTDALQDRIPTGFIPIGDDPAANAILLSLHPSTYGKIYLFDHENEPEEGLENLADYPNIYWLADSFEAFLDNLKTKEEIDRLLDERIV